MQSKFRQLINNRFIRSGALLTVINFIIGFLNYLFNSLAGKALGPARYSEIVTLFSYFFILSVPLTVVTNEIIRRLGQTGSNRLSIIAAWEHWFWQKISRWSFLLIPYALLLIWLPRWTNLTFLSSASILLVLLFTFLSVFYTGAFLGLQLIVFYGIVMLISTLIKLAGPVLVLLSVGNLNTVLLLLVLSALVLPIGGKLLLSSKIKTTKQTMKPVNRRIIQILFTRSLLIITLSTISLNLLNNLDVVFVKKFFQSDTAGLYGAWSLFGKIIFYVLTPVLTTSYIFFSAKEEQRRHHVGNCT